MRKTRRQPRSVRAVLILWAIASAVSCSKKPTETATAEATPKASVPESPPSDDSAEPVAEAPVAEAPVTAADFQLMKGALAEVKKLLGKCAAPRERDITPACMALLRASSSESRAIDSRLLSVPKSAPGMFPLGMAISLSQNCCDCSPRSARMCDVARGHAATAESAIAAAKSSASAPQ